MSTINKVIFKAYDVRGRYPDELNEAAVSEIVSVLAKKFGKGKVAVGHDTRLSSPALYKSALNALVASGQSLVAVPLGPCTTPMFYFLCNELKAAGGVMVTASHAPKEFNGLKVVNEKGEVVSGSEILKWII